MRDREGFLNQKGYLNQKIQKPINIFVLSQLYNLSECDIFQQKKETITPEGETESLKNLLTDLYHLQIVQSGELIVTKSFQ